MSYCADLLYTELPEALEESDSGHKRAERIVWLSQHQVPYGLISGPTDSMRLLREAGCCFVYGQYVATLVLAGTFIEHALVDALQRRNLAGRISSFKTAIQRAAEKSVFPTDLLARADELRKIWNPFAHPKQQGHQHSLGNRFVARKQHPQSDLEEDAKAALEVMFAFSRIKQIPATDAPSRRSPHQATLVSQVV